MLRTRFCYVHECWLFVFQDQDDPTKTAWPDYYIERINTMSSVSQPDLNYVTLKYSTKIDMKSTELLIITITSKSLSTMSLSLAIHTATLKFMKKNEQRVILQVILVTLCDLFEEYRHHTVLLKGKTAQNGNKILNEIQYHEKLPKKRV